MRLKQLLPIGVLVIGVCLFFADVFTKGFLPIPADTIVGLYHPFRDSYADQYPNGIPFKNFLITDPVRQQYPWRSLSVSLMREGKLPLWNPYEMAGVPLLGGVQAASLYPLNILFFIIPFHVGWTTLIILQPLLASFFLYLYLDHLKIKLLPRFLGSFTFAFGGFSIAWLEWGTVLHVGLWLPFILLCIDKIYLSATDKKKLFLWQSGLLFSLVMAFLAGHLQTFFYLSMVAISYGVVRWIQHKPSRKTFFLFFIPLALGIAITFLQWHHAFQLIGFSARDIDQVFWQKEGWFIPWQHAIQFIAPDFFGNPTTLNYWGVWNYAEFVGYVGIAPLIMALFALFFRHDKKTLFFGTLFFVSLIFEFPTTLAKIPYLWDIPFLSMAQPTRLLFITDFSLALLASFGFDHFLKRKKEIIYPLLFLGILFLALWLFVLWGNGFLSLVSKESILVLKRNLILPTSLLFASSVVIILSAVFSKAQKMRTALYALFLLLAVFDLFRFGRKFTPFTNKEYLFPQTKTVDFLQKKVGNSRVMTTDSRIFPPNFASYYRIQSIDGYDPLYLKRYAEFIAASERGKPSIDPPFGFNRIITPHNFNSKIIDLLGVQYLLSLSDISSPKFTKVFQEGQTRVYKNRNVLSRAFFVEGFLVARSKKEAIEKLFEIDLRKTAVIERIEEDEVDQPVKQDVEQQDHIQTKPSIPLEASAKIRFYSENKIIIEAQTNRSALLVLTDAFYPTWVARIDGEIIPIYRTNYLFRGIFVSSAGFHTIEFSVGL